MLHKRGGKLVLGSSRPHSEDCFGFSVAGDTVIEIGSCWLAESVSKLVLSQIISERVSMESVAKTLYSSAWKFDFCLNINILWRLHALDFLECGDFSYMFVPWLDPRSYVYEIITKEIGSFGTWSLILGPLPPLPKYGSLLAPELCNWQQGLCLTLPCWWAETLNYIHLSRLQWPKIVLYIWLFAGAQEDPLVGAIQS